MDERHNRGGYEKRDINPLRVALVGVGLMLLIAIGGAVSWLYFGYMTAGGPVAAGRPAADRLPPAPRLQINGPEELKEMRAGEDRRLNSYGWVDRDLGVVHIPIDRAMTMIANGGSKGARKNGGEAKSN